MGIRKSQLIRGLLVATGIAPAKAAQTNIMGETSLARLDLRRNLWKAIAIQGVIFLVFMAIVYADRCIIEDMFKSYGLIKIVRFFHWVFFDVLSTVAYASLGLVYVVAKGIKSWKIGAAIFVEGVVLIRLGMEDALYYLVFREAVPSKLPWLNYNPFLLSTSYVVSSIGLGLSIFISTLVIATIWMLLMRRYEL